jgi:hypothetical protein
MTVVDQDSESGPRIRIQGQYVFEIWMRNQNNGCHMKCSQKIPCFQYLHNFCVYQYIFYNKIRCYIAICLNKLHYVF